MPEQQEHNFLEGYDLTHTGDVMASKEQEGLDREQPKIQHNDVGIDKAAQEQFRNLRETYKHDSESGMGMHNEAGMLLPNKIEDEPTKAKYLSKLIDNPTLKKPEDQMDDLLNRYSMN